MCDAFGWVGLSEVFLRIGESERTTEGGVAQDCGHSVEFRYPYSTQRFSRGEYAEWNLN